MWRLHINKHFETAPTTSTAIRGPNKALQWHKDNTIGKQECMSWEKEGLCGREGWCWGGRGEFKKQIIWCRSWAAAFDHSEDYMDCDFQGLFALKRCRFWKGPLKWQLFLSFSPCVVQGPGQGSETLISLGRDSYTHTRTHKHTQSGGSKPFVAGSWSTDLPRCWRTIRGQPVKQAVSQLLSASQ